MKTSELVVATCHECPFVHDDHMTGTLVCPKYHKANNDVPSDGIPDWCPEQDSVHTFIIPKKK